MDSLVWQLVQIIVSTNFQAIATFLKLTILVNFKLNPGMVENWGNKWIV